MQVNDKYLQTWTNAIANLNHGDVQINQFGFPALYIGILLSIKMNGSHLELHCLQRHLHLRKNNCYSLNYCLS